MVSHYKKLYNIEDTSINNAMDMLQRILETNQKYQSQHPELYVNRVVEIVIPYGLLRYKNLYYYLIPFNLTLRITLIVNSNIPQCDLITDSIRLLMENNVNVNIEPF